MKAKHHHLAAAFCIAAALCAGIALAACTDDTRTPGTTTQPIILNATVAAPAASPASRANTAANTAANQWTAGDEITVEIDGIAKRYIIDAPTAAGATATLRPADAANTHFWPGLNQPVTVRAWRYGAVTDLGGYTSQWDVKPAAWKVSANQDITTDGETGYQQSDFLYAPAKSVSYDAAAGTGLTFYHQTARVVVKIRKAGLVDDGNKESMEVRLGDGGTDKTMLTHATFDASQIDPAAGKFSGLTADETTEKGSITAKPMPADAATHGYARCYEALVIPQNMDGEKFISILIPGTGTYYYKPAAGEANLRGGYTYTYDITVSEHGTLHVTVGTPITPWGQVEGGSGTAYNEIIDLDNPQPINDDRVYLMTGTNRDENILNITGGSPTLIVRNLTIDGCIHITGGTPEIRVEGTNNYINGYNNPPIWLDGDDANVRITGRSITESSLALNVYENNPHAAIGTKGTRGRKEDFRCGNISISNLTLKPNSNTNQPDGGAVIGTGGAEGNRKCGNITITDAHIIAWSGRGAATIGFGSPFLNTDLTGTTYEMGDITITNSTIESVIHGDFNAYSAHIGGGRVAAETYKVGAIRINTDKSAADFFAKFRKRGSSANEDDEVIVGFPEGAKPKDGTRFDIYWNGKPVGTPITWGMVPTLP